MEDKYLAVTEETIAYYDQNAEEFIQSTINADVSELYIPFEQQISPGAKILDLGCGSGRDSRYFRQCGYDVIAVDPSSKMCEQTRSIADIPVFQMKAEDISFKNEFDAVWACASLLHVSETKQKKVLMLIGEALRPGGICYCSWKYGDEVRTENGRTFTDHTEHSLNNLLKDVNIFEIMKCWMTEDVRNNRNQKWINVILKKMAKDSLTESAAGMPGFSERSSGVRSADCICRSG